MNNAFQTASTRDKAPDRKDAQAFAQGKDPCYWIDEKSFTRDDFIQAANRDVAVAERLFSLIDGQEDPHTALYQLGSEGIIRIPGYISEQGERTVLVFQGPPIPTKDQQQLLKTHGWEALFPDLTHPRVWTQQVPDVSVPSGIAYIDLIRQSELEGHTSSEEGNDHA